MIEIGRQVIEGSVRPCDECGNMVPFDNPDAEYRVCNVCLSRMNEEP
jgi:hypothetical protein